MLIPVGLSEELYEICLKTCFLSGNKKGGHLPTGSDLLLVKVASLVSVVLGFWLVPA